MAFTRDDLKEYEKQPVTVVDDKTNPFTGDEPDPIEPAVDQTDDDTQTDDDADPSGAVDETPPDESGDGASDANDAPPDSSTGDADPSGESEDQPTEGTPPKKGSARERIQELVDERDSYRDYGTYAQEQVRAREQRIQELETQLQSGKPATTDKPTVPEDDPVPTLEDPDVAYDPEKFTKKTQQWASKVKENAEKRAAAAKPTVDPEAKKREIVGKFVERSTSFAQAHKDFEETVKLLPQFAPDTSATIVLSEIGPDILYYLGKRKSEAVRIAKLSPAEQLLELGSIRDKVRAQKKPSTGKDPVLPPKGQTPAPQGASQTPAKPKSTSNAPPPHTPVRGGGRRDAVPITDPNLSMDEFVTRDRAEKLRRKEASRMARGLR